ncbi:tripartite tricarboxylate transporter substrate binding protein [Caldimonas thermodepolymerans]|jgi:tripartite-type tricarboxylate transporter receptor subunit TctC|uniref:ABC transporter substrate-binding protein n=1 Tax=Caldimonas thermodepolymerans TaxID=215580 RepID=A0A2S5T915_9BURK|nr:tripartite tricarboxylate transporter substrate binding protein [Caldimonas thermodepolymerans]PPE71449.1 ABC transporter substrate-binding protein [Caldimonas thermodepolymerans]QPC30478.1 tripartite tricarboxylate transporter substrate binding protein [Caldimonas thermodepolymerans]RDI02939.1 tripartite-type tricarboxylate transporter receptor subunit TctC [Caldimonas thermodepolymerans]TCP08584.1 tripartite-type tricarboxylate transporter receptor subunit TctC [Caldimonas thermodepolymera
MKKYLSALLLALPLLAPSAASAQAAAYPSKPLRWVVPYAAGGGSDFLARTIGQALAARIGQPVIIDNKPGGNTSIGASDVARSPGDGYTVLSADNGTLVFNPVLYKSLTYNATKDFTPVTLMGRFPMILVVNPGFGVNSAKEFIAKAKAEPGALSFASAGAGSPHHLAMELLNTEAGLSMVHVPYRGAAPALGDVVSGQVPAMMVDYAAGAAFIRSGKLKPLAVAHASRLAQLPDVPTFAELGYKSVEAAALVGMVAPASTPADIVATLNKRVVESIKDPEVHKRLVEFGVEPVGSTAAEYAELLRTESQRWHKLIRDLNITLD